MNGKWITGIARFALILSALPLLAGIRVVPHVTRAGGSFETEVHLNNASSEAQTFILQPYALSGEALPVVEGRLSAGESKSLLVQDLFQGDVSHFTVAGSDLIRVSAAYLTPGLGKQLVRVNEIHDGATSWSLQAGDWNEEYDAYAVVNLGENASPVWLHQRDESGRILASQCLSESLAPNAKAFGLIDRSLFQDESEGSFEIIGDQHLAVMNLRGSLQGEAKMSIAPVFTKRESESERDDAGIWFITGGSLSDVFEMMGYNVANDRLWQGELLRRTGSGRMAEIFGRDFLDLDIQIRTTGYSAEEYEEAFANLDQEQRTVIQSYVDGFNRRIAEIRANPTLMPFEFLALGFTDVDDWTPTDVLAWATTLQHQFTIGYGSAHLFRNIAELQDLVARYGPIPGASMFTDLHLLNDPTAVTMIQGNMDYAGKVAQADRGPLPILKKGLPDFRELADEMEARDRRRVELQQRLSIYIKGGSYAWVVSGDKTESGNPIIHSGPQLESPAAFSAPSIVQEGSIRGGGIEVAGLNVTGVPSIIVGRTPHHSWSFQVGHANTQDLYLESAESIVKQRLETYNIAGEEPLTLPVVETVHGPVINAEPLVALKSSHRYYEFDFVKATIGLARATDMDSFNDAVEDLAVTMHICYADKDGNIAYWHSGREPVRPAGEYRLPQGAISAPNEWDAAVIHPLFHDRNSSKGYYGGWNNKADASWRDVNNVFRFGTFHWAHVINDYLESNNRLTFDDVANLAVRIGTTEGSMSGAGNTWKFVREPFMAAVANHATPERQAAIDMIDNWNGQAIEGDTVAEWAQNMDYADAWVLQDRWILTAVLMTVADELNTPVWGSNAFTTRFNLFLHCLYPNTTVRPAYNWFSNRSNPNAPQTRDEIIIAALDLAMAQLGERPWGEGLRPLTQFNHAVFGDLTELFPEIATPYSNRSTYTHVVEYGENGPVRIGHHFTLGQSGDVRLDASGMPVINANAFSMMPYFATFTFRDFPLYE